MDYEDCVFNILYWLNQKDIISCSLVNKLFNHASQNELLWEKQFKLNFIDIQCISQFYVMYKKWFILTHFIIKNNTCHDYKFIWKSLDLSRHNIRKIPSEISLLNHITEFTLSYNLLRKLPIEFTQLTNLKELNLNSNLFKTIPPALLTLTHLKFLCMENNQLSKIPTQISQLINLKFIFLGQNQIKKIPNSFYTLPKLIKAGFNHNPLLHVSKILTALNKMPYFIDSYFDEEQFKSITTKQIILNILLKYK